MPPSTARPPRTTSPTSCTTRASRSRGLPTGCRSAANSIISMRARCRRRCGNELFSSNPHTETIEMTKRGFGRHLALGALIAAVSAIPAARAQQAEPAPKAGKLINAGDVLSGELNAVKVRGGKKGKRVATYQVTSEPRRLPPPSGLCNLETGPETFQLITSSDTQAAQLKNFVGKEISVKVEEVACAQDADQMSEAVVTKWSVVTKH